MPSQSKTIIKRFPETLQHLASSLVVKKLWIEGRKVDFIGGLCKHKLRGIGILIRVICIRIRIRIRIRKTMRNPH